MTDYLLPFFFALLAWWFSTGVVLYLNHLRATTYRWSILASSIALIACLVGLQMGKNDTTQIGALLAFTQALLVWAWLEMSYFMGFITGPRKRGCPPGTTGWRRFGLALQTSLHHEAAVVLLGILLIATTWGAANQVGTWTFLTLWLMRWSSKLNLFWGVPHVNEHWFPMHLRYLTTYMRRRPMNLFFPLAVSFATALMVVLIVLAISSGEGFSRTGYMLIATLLALGVLEHWFMVLPLHDSALWNWALKLASKSAPKRRPGARKSNDAAQKHPGRSPVTNPT